MAAFKQAWGWVKLNWKWLLLPVGALLWILGRLAASKKVVVESGVVVEHDIVVADADTKAASEAASVVAAANVEARRVAAAQAAAVSKLNDALKAAADNALEDPEATNTFLKGVSGDMRK